VSAGTSWGKSWRRVRAILPKDWREIARNSTAMLSMILPAVLFVLIPLALIYVVPERLFEGEELPPEFATAIRAVAPALGAMSDAEMGQVWSSRRCCRSCSSCRSRSR